MPYDPAPVGPDALDDQGRRTSLTLQLQGGGGDPETVLVLGRPRGDRIAVREFPAHEQPTEYEADVHALIARLEHAVRAGRRVSAEPYLVREWLAGRG